MAAVPPIHGSCDRRFEPVRDAFAANLRDHGEVGAAVTVLLEGRPVVDLWAGWMDGDRTRPWRRETLVDVFSVGKPMAALAVLMLAERGRLGLDAPVARLWPSFAARGKAGVTPRMILAHRAGLPAIRATLPRFAMYDATFMAETLAAEEPWWTPGERHGYHTNTFGFLAAELVRRAAGEPFGVFFSREIAGRLGADVSFGLSPRDEARAAEFLLPETIPPLDELPTEPPDRIAGEEDRARFLRNRAYFNPLGISGFGTVNTRPWRAAVMPSANGHATARGAARIYGVLAGGGRLDGVRLLAPAAVEEAAAEAAVGPDAVLDRPSRFGLGVQLTQPERPLGIGPRTFGHFGAGGSLAFADPDADLAFAYLMNLPGPRWRNPRNQALVDAVSASL